MYFFGTGSEVKLKTGTPEIVAVARLVMSWQVYDFTVVWVYRDKESQNQAFLSGNSMKQWPGSKHNRLPSPALDFAPWVNSGIPWKDTHAFAVLGGMFISAGVILGTPITYGGDWDMDGETTDQILMDWGHIHLA